MKIFLIGFMGSGKSTMGRKLASYLKYEFIDLDKILELKAGMSISDFFEQNGEDDFRKLEKNTLQGGNFNDHTIIATGGGAPCYFDNMDWMNNNGVTVYLTMPSKTLASRLKHASDRPLIKGMTEEELLQYINEKLNEREPSYKKAQFIISGIDLTVEKLAQYLEPSLN